jgi:hypothetical protein
MMRGGYSQRNAKSSIRGGGFAGKQQFPSDRALQEIGIRDSNGQGRNTPRGGFSKPYHEGMRGNGRPRGGQGFSRERKIVYQAKDLDSLVAKRDLSSQANSHPVPIRLDSDENKEPFASQSPFAHPQYHGQHQASEEVLAADGTLAAQAERIAEESLVN